VGNGREFPKLPRKAQLQCISCAYRFQLGIDRPRNSELRTSSNNMQHDEQGGFLMQRRGILRAFLRLRYDQWTFPTELDIAKGLRRLQEQLCLRGAVQIRVWSSSFNVYAVSDRDCLVRYQFKRKGIGFIVWRLPDGDADNVPENRVQRGSNKLW
jgi:hypothetical protein